MTTTFEQLSLSEPILKSLQEMKFHVASPIQAQTIPLIMEGRDIIGQAQTGTGKTAAFAIPLIEKIDSSKKHVQALVMCPTRELAMQVANEFRKLLKFTQGISVVSIYGGEPISKQFRALARNPQIIVGTPGRMLDHYRRGSIKLKTIQTVVLDEADEMLNMGFRDDIETILNGIPVTARQTILFSATISRPILELTTRYQKSPEHIKVQAEERDMSKIEQLYVEVHGRKKMSTLVYLLEFHQPKLALVFCNTKRMVDELVTHLRNEGYPADGLHGGLAQPKRDRVMNSFRKGTVQFLVATDVAARGIDVSDIDTVFNYDLPQDIENYIHRIGRTGRAGKSGRAYTFVGSRERHQLNRLRQTTNASLRREEIPMAAHA